MAINYNNVFNYCGNKRQCLPNPCHNYPIPPISPIMPQVIRGATGAQGPRGATGAQGLRGVTGATGAGATGATGADGLIGTISGVVATVGDLPATGEQGEMYYVEENDSVYVWDVNDNEWKLIDIAQGPRGAIGATGATGPTGATGADGLIGTISGVVATVGDLPATGEQGEMYYVEEDDSVYVWDVNDNEWKLIDIAQGPRGAIGATGATGPTGATGADGLIGTISGIVATVGDLPATGEQGEIYYVEENDSVYVWDVNDNEWKLIDIAQGPRGATGATGADGLIGTISGVVATVGDLPATGEQGEMYYVEEDDSVYVWDVNDNEWKLIDIAQGPRGATGATGPTGPTGADGLIGTISGVVATVGDLPATGEQGEMYYVEENDSVYVWDVNDNEWKLIDIAQGPRGATGATGADGSVGTISGVVATVADLPATAEQGEMYYVEENNSVYIWDADDNEWKLINLAQGPRGATGAKGASASSYMIIPFASTEAPMTYINNTISSRLTLLGFGYGDRRDRGLLTAADYSIPIEPVDQSFILSYAAGNDNYQLVFSVPFDVSIRSIYLTAGNYASFSPPAELFPYIQLFSSEANSNTFHPISGAIAMPEVGIPQGTNVPADTLVTAHVTGLDIKLSAGTRIGIGAMARMPNYTGGNQTFWLYFTGGIGLTYEMPT